MSSITTIQNTASVGEALGQARMAIEAVTRTLESDLDGATDGVLLGEYRWRLKTLRGASQQLSDAIDQLDRAAARG